MNCSTGKNGYFNEPEVQEALIRSQISFRSSATNYYVCHECGEFHLTSKAGVHPILKDPNVLKRIADEKREQDWNNRIR